METNESAVDYNPLHVRNLRDARRAPRMLAVLVRRLMSLGGVGAPPLPRPLVFLRACARDLQVLTHEIRTDARSSADDSKSGRSTRWTRRSSGGRSLSGVW